MRFITPEFETSGAAVGLLVLTSDEAMESEVRHWLPAEITLHHARVRNAIDVNRETLAAMLGELPDAVRQLPGAPDYRVIAYGCTSGSMVIGSDRVRAAVQSVHPGVAVTDPFTAVKARLDNVGAKRIGLLLPYEPDVSQGIIDGLQQDGYDVVDALTFNEPNDENVCRISPASVLEGLTSAGADTSIDAVVGSCTNLRALTILDEAERQLGKPVMTSNSALAWHISTLCNSQH